MAVDHERVGAMVIGVQKAGTSALFDYLRGEPGISPSGTKEPHFFDDESVDWDQPDYERYHSHFEPADDRVRCEATPIYSYWPNSLERIAAYNPDARLIWVLRDPVERAWSHWRMEYARGDEAEPFSWCIREGRERSLDSGAHRVFSYVERGFYGQQADRLFALFPREQVLILRSTDQRDDPNRTLGHVREFLRLPRRDDVARREANVGRDIDYGSTLAESDVHYLRELYTPDMARLHELIGWSFP